MADIRLLTTDDLQVLCAVADGLFDNPVDPDQAAAFLADPANLMVLAMAREQAVGMTSATVLRHPDKPPILFIQEVGVREAFQRRGIARAMLARALAEGQRRGCTAAWVATEGDNGPALALYRAIGGVETPGIAMFDLSTGGPARD
jgi:ribosomal protein S18 acetylase RimI-like enzyme